MNPRPLNFPSIDHAILEAQLRRVFKDARLLALLDVIIGLGVNPEPAVAYFSGDDLFTPHERRRGLPIGNLTSQLLANFHLAGFDHWVKQSLGVRAYLRFVDDCVLFDDSKERLHGWLVAVRERLEELRLRLHPRKYVVRRTEEGLPFLGYVVRPGRLRVRGETVRRFRRRLRRRPATANERVQSLAAWQGHVRLAGGFRRLGHLRA